MRPVVVLSEPIHEAGLAVLRAAAEVLVLQQSTPAILRRAIADADAVIVRLSPLDAEMMAGAPRLRVIGRHGAGLDNVDLRLAFFHRAAGDDKLPAGLEDIGVGD